MDRVAIKEEAKKIIRGNKWNFWKASIVLGLISFGIGFVIGLILTIAGCSQEMVSGVGSGVASLILLPTTVGLYAYILKMARGEEFSLNDLKAYYPFYLKILLIDILVAVLVVLASILLIIPGIILSIAYTMVYFCFVDNTELTAKDTLTKSRTMMKGFKLDYFIFNLSFIGWLILVPFTLGILAIWLAPYMSVAQALYYDKLSKKNN